MKLTLEVGTYERHLVEFSWSHWTGAARVGVDGKIVLKSGMQLASQWRPAKPDQVSTEETWVIGGRGIQLIEEWTAQVGESEAHRVTIKKTRPKWFAGFRPHTYQVFVDDGLVQEQTGY